MRNTSSRGSIELATACFSRKGWHIPTFTDCLHVIHSLWQCSIVPSIKHIAGGFDPLFCVFRYVFESSCDFRHPSWKHRPLANIANAYAHVWNDLINCLGARTPSVEHPLAANAHGLVHELSCKGRRVILHSVRD